MRKTCSPASVLFTCVLLAALLAGACGKNISETIDDATVTTRVKTALLNDPEVGALRIDVETVKGVVTLSGAVKSAAEEQQAIAVAKRITGVRDVKSTLQIQQVSSRRDPAAYMPVA